MKMIARIRATLVTVNAFILLPTGVGAQSPGGVTAGLNIWHKANAFAYNDNGVTLATNGQAVRLWNDNSPTVVNVGQTTLAAQPTFDEDAINYNPALQFDGVNDYLSANNYILSGDMSHFIVAAPESSVFNSLVKISPGVTTGNTAVYICANGGTSSTRFVFRNAPAQTGGNDLFTGSSALYGQPSIMDFRRQQGGLQEKWINAGDHQNIAATVANYNGSNYSLIYGMNSFSTRHLMGAFGEHIKYSRALTNVEKNKVDSYLAIKYGITMEENYTAPNGFLLYNVSTYGNQVIGIGREDVEALIQRQSHTLDDSSRIYLNTLQSTNVANTGSFMNNSSYVVMGNDQGQLCATTASLAEMPAGLLNCNLYSRLEREWKITKTNYGESFNLDLAIAPCAIPSSVNVADIRLLVDDDGDFSNGGTQCYYNGDGTGIVISYAAPYIKVNNISNVHIPPFDTRVITLGSVHPATPLPVSFMDMTVACNDSKAVIAWSTATESNNDYFKIEKSIDMVTWNHVAIVPGSGSSQVAINYSYADINWSASDKYYRLIQFDFDGNFTVLKSVSINCNNSNARVFPNPFTSFVIVEYPFNRDQHIEIRITDNSGRVITNEMVSQYSNLYVIDTCEIDTKGVYILSIVRAGEILAQAKITRQ